MSEPHRLAGCTERAVQDGPDELKQSNVSAANSGFTSGPPNVAGSGSSAAELFPIVRRGQAPAAYSRCKAPKN
jgi:hypothetical protein